MSLESMRYSVCLLWVMFVDILIMRRNPRALSLAFEYAARRAGSVPLEGTPMAWVINVTDFLWVMPKLRLVVAEILTRALAQGIPEVSWLYEEMEKKATDLYPDA